MKNYVLYYMWQALNRLLIISSVLQPFLFNPSKLDLTCLLKVYILEFTVATYASRFVKFNSGETRWIMYADNVSINKFCINILNRILPTGIPCIVYLRDSAIIFSCYALVNRLDMKWYIRTYCWSCSDCLLMNVLLWNLILSTVSLPYLEIRLLWFMSLSWIITMFDLVSIHPNFFAIYRSFSLNRLMILDYLSKFAWIFLVGELKSFMPEEEV